MNLDRQIKNYEDRISRLEDSRRNPAGDPAEVDEELEKAYSQIALLKIRKMMLTL